MRSRRSALSDAGARRTPQRPLAAGAVRLMAVLIAVTVTWTVVLPKVAHWPRVAAKREANRARGINPGATYYTELRAMPMLEAKLRQRIDRDRQALWRLRP